MIHKKIKKMIVCVIIFALALEMLPAFAVGNENLNIPETTEITVGEQASTVDADIPPTFIIDDSCNYDSETDIPESDTSEQVLFATDYTEINSMEESQSTEPDEITDEESANISRLSQILSENDEYSDLSSDDKEFLCSYAQVNEDDLEELELQGLALKDSILYAQIACKYDIDINDIYIACQTADDCINLSAQLELYVSFLDDNLVGTSLDTQLRGYLLDGYTFDQVTTVYSISVTLAVSMSLLLNNVNELVDSNNLSDEDKSNYQTLASELGVNVNVLVDYAEEINLSFSQMEQLIEEGLYHEAELNDYPGMSTLEDTDETEYPDKYLSAPYSYDYNQNESVNLNTGELVYENIDYTLPGVNGLDLVIGRRYDSDAANVYNPVCVRKTKYIYYYVVFYITTAYYHKEGIPDGRWDHYDNTEMRVFTNKSEAVEYYDTLSTDTDTIEDVNDGVDLILYYSKVIKPIIEGYKYSYRSSTESNTYLGDRYGLGQGWSFMFSSIEDQKYLHLADGREYEISNTTATDDSNLKDYTLSDLRLEQESGIYSNGSVSSDYTLYYKDGKQEFFSSDGKLIGIKDRFGNTIKFVNDTYNGYARITITDTLNRVITISGQDVTGGHTMSVSLPEAVTLSYIVEDASSPVSCSELAQYHDPMNNTTAYSYTISSGGFAVSVKDTDGATNYYVNLTTITHPTGAQSVYTYDYFDNNLGSSGLQRCYRLTSRADMIGTTAYNAKTYTYSSNNYSGWPEYSDPNSLPSDFTYYSTVTTTASGVGTKYTFNNEHLTTTVEEMLGSIKIQNVSYQYNTDELPTQETTKKYSYDNQSEFVQSIKAYAYDNKANITASWSPLADGNINNTEYKTTYTYDLTYSLPVSVTYKQDASTTVLYQYLLDTIKKQVIREEIYVNNTRKSMTDYTYYSYGNVQTKKSYKDNFVDYNLTEYSYQNNAYLSEEKNTGVVNADGEAILGTPSYSNGTVVKTYHYDNLGRLDQSTDANGYTTYFSYDNNGNVTTITNPDNTTKQYAWNYTDNYVIVTDEAANQIKYTYTPLGLENQTIDVISNTPVKSMTYDALSRLSTVTDSVYNSIKTYSYDYLSRITSEVVVQGSTILSDITCSYNDAIENGTLQKVTKTIVGDSNAPSIVTTQYTDKMGYNVKNGRILDGIEYFDAYTFDYIGNMMTEKLAYAEQLGLNYSSKYEYDYAQHVTKAYNADEDYIVSVYDSLGNLVTLTDYAEAPTTYTYDSLGRMLTETKPIDESTGFYSTAKYYYDAEGNAVSKKISNNLEGQAQSWSQTDYEFDSLERLKYITVYNGASIDNVTKYTYDGVGNVLTKCTGLSSKTASDGELTQYSYDQFGNIETLTDPLGQTEIYEYNNLGKLETKTDRNGNITNYVFDGLGRQLSAAIVIDGVQDAKVTVYTLTGAKESESNGTITDEYQYDSLGRVTRIDETGNIVKQYTYDIAGNKTLFTLSVAGVTQLNTSYGYDYQNRLDTISENGLLKADYDYDINGNRDSLTYANGSSVDYEYNDANWVTGLTNETGETTLSSYVYTYYADGNQSTKTNGTGRITAYEYDNVGRLKSESESTGLSIDYVYDRFSNRTQMAVTGNESYVVCYDYDDNNRLLTEEKTSTSSVDTTTYFYDPNGNQTAKTTESLTDASGTEELDLTDGVVSGQLSRYNGFNQLVETQLDGIAAAYTYDPSGLRLSKTVNGTRTDYVLDGANVVLETVGDTVTASYVFGVNLVSSDIGGTDYYYLYNAHGDVVQLTNASGAVTKTYDYDAFGNEKNADASDVNSFRYCGEYFDKETGTYYLRARYYDPTIGRFTQEDTNRGDPKDPLSLNLYTYCYNNPILYVDSTGNIPNIRRDLARLAYIWFAWQTREGNLDGLYDFLDFSRDNGIFHAKQECWQKIFGYNLLYDAGFDLATDMLTEKYDFSAGGVDFRIWVWKGDYLNLGAGAEIGIYYGGPLQWNPGTDYAMPMTLSLYDKYGNQIYSWAPSEDTWWITGFSPYYPNVKASDLTVYGTINFKNYPDLWDIFYDKFKKDPMWTLDKDKKLATYTWTCVY